MRKILHISKYYFPFRGGIEQTAQDCVQALKDDYEQKVICFNHEKGDKVDQINGIDVIRSGCIAKIASQSISITYNRMLRDTIENYCPDIIIFHYPNPFVATYLLPYIDDDTKLVIYWHLDIIKQKFIRFFFKSQNQRLLKRANKVIVTSPNYLEGSKWLCSVKEKCVVIPSCINVNRFDNDQLVEKLRENIKKNNEGKIICFAVGRHTKYKGFSYLIKASEYLDDRFRIYIAGKGELTKKLKRQARKNEKIIFLGLISDEELKAYMLAMDIFCFPSITKNEAFGLALAEAMYFGKPSVTFTIMGSGVNYVNIDKQTGIEVPNKDVLNYAKAIKKLANDDSLRDKYGIAARKRTLDNFMNDVYSKKICNLISQL